MLSQSILCHYTEFDPDNKVDRIDKVHLYGTQVLTLTLIWHCFNGSIREGMGIEC